MSAHLQLKRVTFGSLDFHYTRRKQVNIGFGQKLMIGWIEAEIRWLLEMLLLGYCNVDTCMFKGLSFPVGGILLLSF
jgi:hypothetical protein